MDAITQQRLKPLHPVLIARYTLFSTKCEAFGIRMRITQGLRTYAEEDALYAQGRTTPGPIVTDATGGYSAHNFAYACDAAPDDPAFPTWHPDWNSRDARWQQVLDIALGCSLAEGNTWRTFKDAPHYYLPECPATPTDEMRAAFATGGLPAAWELINRLLPATQAPGMETDITT